MLWLTCPTCGERPVTEFRFGGELPHVPDRLTDDAERNLDYVWMFDNVAGVTTERWFHARLPPLVTIRRDPRTDQVVG